jgi:hypothetical protein
LGTSNPNTAPLISSQGWSLSQLHGRSNLPQFVLEDAGQYDGCQPRLKVAGASLHRLNNSFCVTGDFVSNRGDIPRSAYSLYDRWVADDIMPALCCYRVDDYLYLPKF